MSRHLIAVVLTLTSVAYLALAVVNRQAAADIVLVYIATVVTLIAIHEGTDTHD